MELLLIIGSAFVFRRKFKLSWIKAFGASLILYVALIIVVGQVLFSFGTFVKLLLGVIALFIILAFLGNISNGRGLKTWLAKGYNSNLDIEKDFELFESTISDEVKFDSYNIPIGRATGFVQDFQGINLQDIDFYGFSPVRSKDQTELREYGLLVTNQGLFIKYQEESKDNNQQESKLRKKEIRYDPVMVAIPYQGLWYFNVTEKKVTIKSVSTGEYQFSLEKCPVLTNGLSREINALIRKGVTRNLMFEQQAASLTEEQIESVDESIKKAYYNLQLRENAALSASTGFLVGELASNNVAEHFKSTQLNAQNKAIMRRNGNLDIYAGKGEAAEYANNVKDTLLMKKVSSDGGNFSKSDPKGQGQNAIDRTVTNRFTGQTNNIQSKYYKDARTTYDSFKNGGYSNDIALEVPAEQYKAVKKMMKEAGDNRQLIKGVSSKWAQGVTKAGTIPSITTDLLDGAIVSTQGASISFILVFAQAKYQGLDTKEAAKMSTYAAIQTAAVGSLMYAGSQQFAKTQIGKQLAQQLGKSSIEMAKYASGALTVGLVYGPSVVDALRGRISPDQLLKNASIGTAGVFGGVVGSAAGPVGAITGSLIGGTVAKKFMDTMIEDDAKELYEIFREEFIEYLYATRLTPDELNELINRTFAHKKFGKRLKDIYQVGHKLEGIQREEAQRAYVRENLLENNIADIFKQRAIINEEELQEAIEYSNEIYNDETIPELAY